MIATTQTDAAFERRRTEAERRHRVALAEQYPDGVPAYKAEGTPEFDAAVRDRMAMMAWEVPPWSPPVGGFQEPLDWVDTAELVGSSYRLPSGRTVSVDLGVERRIEGAVIAATLRHRTEHQAEQSPHCTECELRRRRAPYGDSDLRHAHLSDAEVREQYREDIEARVRGALLRGGRLPDPTPRKVQQDEGAAYLDGMQVLTLEPPGDLVGGVIPQQSVGVLRARDGVGKTLAAIDLGLHLAFGHDFWHGREIEWRNKGELLFVAGEGPSAFGKRVQAWMSEHDEEMTPEVAERLHVRSGSVNLFTGGPAYDELLAMARRRRPELTVIDTLATNAVGCNFDKDTDAVVVHGRLRELCHASGGAVLLVMHTNKSDLDGRGSSAWEDNADFVLHIKEAK